MFVHEKIQSTDDFFTDLNKRTKKCVYFYRVCGYNEQVNEFIIKYYDSAIKNGVVIDGKISNPSEANLSYYDEVMGDEFRLDNEFIANSLKRWLPRMDGFQVSTVAMSIYDTLTAMKRLGKNDNVIKNTYVKFMCWLYYKFERVVIHLGDNTVPKILYGGDIGRYEIMLISMLSDSGCDVLLLQTHGDEDYLKIDPSSGLSHKLELPNMTSFPDNFSLKSLGEELTERKNIEKLYGTAPSITNCTNAWIDADSDIFEMIKLPPLERGGDKRFFYNCLCRINGVEDKVSYKRSLYQFQLELKNSGRQLLILENSIPQPTPDEVAFFGRENYTKRDQMLMDLVLQLKFCTNTELRRLMNKAFIDVVIEASKLKGMTLSKLTYISTYLICMLKRYYGKLFAKLSIPQLSCMIYLGGCRNIYEVAFIKLLSRLPVDVLILVPNKYRSCAFTDKLLYEIEYTQSMEVTGYPTENSQLQLATAAYHAERELDEVIYSDTGIYRNHQYNKAIAVTLQTMYEEIEILWDQEIKFRPNFSTVDDVVNVPVIFAKVSGVRDGLVGQYWSDVRELMTADTIVVKNMPLVNPCMPNPMLNFAGTFVRNGVLQRNIIKTHPAYQYRMLREEVQNYILDKLQLLLNQKLIYCPDELIVSVVLNMPKELLKLMQKFDFTKKNPKIIYINTTDTLAPIEDSVLIAFLNLAGFDIVFFVPTGYRIIEQNYTKNIISEHQVGEYMYDLVVPSNISTAAAASKSSRKNWLDIFKKGK